MRSAKVVMPAVAGVAVIAIGVVAGAAALRSDSPGNDSAHTLAGHATPPPMAAAHATPDGPYVLSDSPPERVKLRECPHLEPEGVTSGECGTPDELPDYSMVIMRCWVSTVHPGNAKGSSKKWFYVNEVTGPHPGYSGYVFSDLVKNPTPGTPECTDAIISQFEMPKYVPPPPLFFTVTGSCTTAGGTLTATSANFTPGTEFGVSATYPNGSPYPLAGTKGMVRADGTVPWTWPCAGDPAGAYRTDLVDYGTGRTVTAIFQVGKPDQTTLQPTPPQTPNTQVPPAPPGPGPSPAPTRLITVSNKVTNGAAMQEDRTPAYLSNATHNFCRQNGCMLPDTYVSTGASLTATCQMQGDRTTNGNDHDPTDDNNPGLYSSTLWYGIRWPDGRFGYVSEVWIDSSNRGGLGLPSC